MRSKNWVCSVLIVLAAHTAWVPKTKALDELPPGKPTTVSGERGVWWPMQTAQELGIEHAAYKQLTLQTAEQKAAMDDMGKRIATNLELLQIERATTASLKASVVELSTRDAQNRKALAAAIDKQRPLLWYGLGFATAGVLAIAIGILATR